MEHSIKKYLFIVLFIICWSCEDVVEKSTNARPLPSFSVALNISDNDEARSVLHTIDGGYIILVSEVIDWPSYSVYPIRGSSFLVKTDSLGVQEWVTELDNSLAEHLYLSHSHNYSYLEQDIDGSYIIRTSFGSPEFNCFIIDANGSNQTISYKGYDNLLTSNNESYSYDVNGYFDFDSAKYIAYHSISKIGSMGDTLWTRDSIDSKLLAIDSNFMIGIGVSNTLPRILTITDDNGFLFVNFGPLLSIAKFNSNGEIENVTVDTYNHDEDIYLGYPYSSFQSTNDGGYIFHGRALLKLDDNGEIEWFNPNPNSMIERIFWSEVILKETANNNYFLFGSEPEHEETFEYLDWNFSPPFIIEIDNLGNLLSRKDYPQFRRQPVLDSTPDGGYVFSTSYTLENGNVGLVLIKADSEGNILDFEN